MNNNLKVPFRFPARIGGISAIVGVLLIAGVSLMSCGQTIQPGNVGVKIRTLGPNAGVDPAPLPSGWHLNLVGERIAEFPVIQRTYTYTREQDERGPENEEINFSDNNALPMTADVQLVMRIDRTKAPALYTRYRLTFDQLFEGPIRNDVRSAIAAETELVSVEYLYRGGRQQVIQKALARVNRKWEPQGVNISQLDWIGTIRYPQVILDSIQAKTKADADAAAAQAQIAVAKAQADAKIEEARGQAEANRLLAQSIASSPQVVQLRAIEKWDGKLPTTTGGAVPFIDVSGR
ncbi:MULTISPECIES: SPFH domain-containing protein [Asticcacaulis]|uniref:SPFH domain-containing protein n=1 Tax=Asticcacaulis TaxID=76890 RepID=UPI001AEA1EFA|nr:MULTISPECIES: SPFH domain-containing protein [Asticcacaulis]MBP2157568.1 regulator of protease activity HflC (stomatin/prohibitin superfamily) [Asticcacaulis solisilvae]MDR6798613.1 regulator of protease activity HflC (stomatin/prohibitin superfamily) [Asticcacaulis sp. BE141]